MYKVKIAKAAHKSLMRLSSEIAEKIRERVHNYLAAEPRKLGSMLTGEYKGMYRYRYNDYRVIYEVNEEEQTIYVNDVGPRGSIYEK
jgi:mRNA interferase RelE/StbE